MRCVMWKQMCNISTLSHFDNRRDVTVYGMFSSSALFLGINQTDLNKLQRLQNWAAKLIFCAKKQDHATPFLKDLHWLPIKDRIHFKILLFVFKCLNNIGPSYLASMLSLYTSARIGLRSSKDSTRLQEHKMYPRTLISAADRSFYFTAPKLWNILPPALRSSGSVTVFKKQLKSYLFPYWFVFCI